jgi:hypothetical protein
MIFRAHEELEAWIVKVFRSYVYNLNISTTK